MNAVSPQPIATNRSRLAVAGLIFLLAVLGLFTRLGHYALWDDEAGTALSAIGIWRTGDTTALLDHNLVAYESGKDLRDLHERQMPPLPSYLAAPFIGLLGRNAWAARLPFALCGAGCVGLMLTWAMRKASTPVALPFLGIALLTNVSFFLFARQCRYYAPTLLSSTAMAWIYVHRDHRRWQLVLFSVLSLCLFASNYLNWAALWMCLALDYLLWGRRTVRLKPVDWVILILPQAVIGGVILWIWNPFLILSSAEKFPAAGRMLYLWWCARDVVACEFGSLALLVAGVALCFKEKAEMGTDERAKKAEMWLGRSCVCLGVYIVVLSFLVPRPPALRGVAAVRYFTPIIPLWISISVMALTALYRRSKWGTLCLAAAGLGTNLFNGGPLLATGFQSSVAEFVRELARPPGDPYTVAATWIREHVREKESVWVVPDFATYPLMFHAPAPIYAWQLTWPPAREEFKALAPIHFIGREAPTYIIGFGPATALARESMATWNRPEIQYAPVATLDYFWREMHRPELFWRIFRPITNYDRNAEAIYIFKLEPTAPANK